MFKKTTGSKGQGNVGISAAILYFTKEGGIVSLPINDSQEYDLIVDLRGVLHKVQVKTTRCLTKYGVFQVSLKSSGGSKREVYHRVSDSLCDLLFVLCENSNQYLIPREVFVKKKACINLGKEMDQYLVT